MKLHTCSILRYHCFFPSGILLTMPFNLDHEVFPLHLENQREVFYSPLKTSQRIKVNIDERCKQYEDSSDGSGLIVE